MLGSEGPVCMRARALVKPEITGSLDASAVESFVTDGFYIVSKSIFVDATAAQRFTDRMEKVLNGECDRGKPPVKVGKIPAQWKRNGVFSFDYVLQNPAEAQGTRSTSTTLHGINIWQADSFFASLVTDTALGEAVTRLMRWEQYGCRVAQDQIWIKPPHSGPLTYHRDTPYLDFEPKQVCTVWIPFDAVQNLNVGTLEYCAGSHRWGDERRGSANQFYSNDYTALLQTAAEREALRCNGATEAKVAAESLVRRIVPVVGEAGCCSFHDGNTWHGSGANTTGGWRRGIGIHYIRGDAVFAKETGKLWDSLRSSAETRELDEDTFPYAYKPQCT